MVLRNNWPQYSKGTIKTRRLKNESHKIKICTKYYIPLCFYSKCVSFNILNNHFSRVVAPWISFSHLFVDFMHVDLRYISLSLLGIGISLSFHLSLVHDKGIFWEECCLH
jgi:hypothetical protein